MSASIAVLLTFTAWTLALTAVYVGYRVALVLSFKEKANAWTRGAPSHVDPAWVTRFQHAHLNCVENLPLFAAIVLAAQALGQGGVIDGLAWVYMGFRFAQSIVHLVSTTPLFVFLRANMLLGQWVCLVYWLWSLCSAA